MRVKEIKLAMWALRKTISGSIPISPDILDENRLHIQEGKETGLDLLG
jgi:hypothetical protein